MAKKQKLARDQRRAPAQERSRATVEAILEAAAQLLRDEGWERLNTNRVAERAGVSIGSLYGYFADKDAIVEALARRILDDDEALVMAALTQEGDPVPRLIQALVRRHRSDRVYRRLVLSRHATIGGSAEHARRAELAIAAVAARLTPLASRSPSPARAFVASRGILGVCRALTDDDCPAPIAAIEDELVAALRRWLS